MEAIDLETLLILEGTKVNKPALDLMQMEEEACDVAVLEAIHRSHTQNKSAGSPVHGMEAIDLETLLSP
ncbi:hypothetical protein THAOC_05928 [Thalassiosira oceanica]|uniref:Uncharacterized protein n=1 Tax=Thalassiosira oceanica TaxID=159749 RepID=K0T5X8_THAOC|nr:hypothetical protein THAOC_05928 [Thalassiosira oceanica]|eukprot:EJK72534.1 hypothetical protein THAOC_05928 [Thalassiosira oceanica]